MIVKTFRLKLAKKFKNRSDLHKRKVHNCPYISSNSINLTFEVNRLLSIPSHVLDNDCFRVKVIPSWWLIRTANTRTLRFALTRQLFWEVSHALPRLIPFVFQANLTAPWMTRVSEAGMSSHEKTSDIKMLKFPSTSQARSVQHNNQTAQIIASHNSRKNRSSIVKRNTNQFLSPKRHL